MCIRDRYNFRIHDYFLAKALDQVRPGGMVAVITTKGTCLLYTSVTSAYVQEFNRDVNTKVNEHTGYDLSLIHI